MQRTIRPQEPVSDNYSRFAFNMRIPTKIDLSQVKVVWSKEKETAEQEQQRKEELARKKLEKKKKLSSFVQFSKKCNAKQPQEFFKKPQTLDKVIQANKQVEEICRLKIPTPAEKILSVR